MVASLIWNIAYFDKTNAILKSVVNGWSLSAISTFQSGLPMTVTAGKDTNLDGTNNERANLVLAGSPALDPHRSRSDVI